MHSVAGVLRPNSGLLPVTVVSGLPTTKSRTRGLLGGGTGIIRPGEVSLAHNGLLFLDEFPEFPRNVLEMLRQPLEERSVTIARSSMTLVYPAKFMLVAAMNPCKCGFLGDTTRECRCTGAEVQRYLGKISGPLLDRIDLHIEVPAVAYKELRSKQDGVGSARNARTCAERFGRFSISAVVTTPRSHLLLSAAIARLMKPASRPWKWRSDASASLPALTIGSLKSDVLSPISTHPTW